MLKYKSTELCNLVLQSISEYFKGMFLWFSVRYSL